MRLENIKASLNITIPFDKPNSNGIIYTKDAVKNAINKFKTELPIIYRDNDSVKNGVVIGNTMKGLSSVSWDDKAKTCKIIIDGVLYFGGTECILNQIHEGIVSDFDIVSVGLSK